MSTLRENQKTKFDYKEFQRLVALAKPEIRWIAGT
jgi:hypothetical protein